jgi:hypothetical protein
MTTVEKREAWDPAVGTQLSNIPTVLERRKQSV